MSAQLVHDLRQVDVLNPEVEQAVTESLDRAYRDSRSA
jgi:hypothetical protein